MKIFIPLFVLITFYYVEAGIFLKATAPYIQQDAVWLYSNATAITSIAPDVPANQFKKSITPLENLPSSNSEGTTGVLYNRGDSCSPNTIQQPIPLPFYAQDPKSSKVPKIALVKKQEGNCSVYEKILNAQFEGAIGVILYDTVLLDYNNKTLLDDRKQGVPNENNIKIPAYHVDHGVGIELNYQLEKMASVPDATIDISTHLTTRISVRIQLFPSDNMRPTAWELTLLVMIVILGTSILFSVAMHIYMWKKGKRLQETVERYRQPEPESVLPMGKPLLTIARLYEFPTRTIDTLPNEEERKKVENVLSDEKQIEALINTTALTHDRNSTSAKIMSIFRKKRSSTPSVLIRMATPVNNICVVCLEAFKIGDQVRELPCNHEYHCVCIDPWLTSKSGECPLCKFNCSIEAGTKKEDGVPDSSTGIRGFIKRFKADKQIRNSVLPTLHDQRQSTDLQQPSPATNVEVPSSPGLRAALRAIEEAEQQSASEENNQGTVTEPLEAATQPCQIASEEEENLPRASTTSTVTYVVDSDTEVLPNIDIDSLPLFTIDLNNILDDHLSTN